MICRSLNEKEASKVPIMIQASLHFSSKLCCSIVTSVHKDRKDAVYAFIRINETTFIPRPQDSANNSLYMVLQKMAILMCTLRLTSETHAVEKKKKDFKCLDNI